MQTSSRLRPIRFFVLLLFLLPTALYSQVTLHVSPDSLDLFGNAGDPFPTSDSVVLSATGSGTVQFSVHTNQSWLLAFPTGGSISAGGQKNITIAADSSHLSPGNYSGTVTITGGSSTVTVTVNFTVSGVDIAVSPNQVSFQLAPGEQDFVDVIVSVANNGAASVAVNASDSWMSVTTTSLNAPGAFTIIVDASGLGAGTYNGAVSVSCVNGSPCVPRTVSVMLQVTQPFTLTATPSTLELAADRGSTEPGGGAISVAATGSGTFFLDVSTDAAWLVAQPSAGSITGGRSAVSIAISAYPGMLDAGVYHGTVSMRAGSASTSVSVTFRVEGIDLFLSTTTPVRFSNLIPGQPVPSQVVRVGASGQAGTFHITDTAAWLSVTPTDVSHATDLVLTFSVDTTKLSAGTNNATVTVTCVGSPPCAPLNIPVIATTSGQVSLSEVISQIADGNGWKTTLILVNLDSHPATFTLRFWDGAGKALPLSDRAAGEVNNVSGTIAVGGSYTFETPGDNADLSQGWAQLETSSHIEGLAVFRQRVAGRPDQEAAVTVTHTAPRFVLPFDNQNAVTAMALVNTSASTGGTVTGTPRNQVGQALAGADVSLPAQGQAAFALTDRFASTGGQRGVVDFSTGSGEFSALGLRFSGSAFTSFPALVPPEQKPATQVVSQIADGNLWQTSVILVNLDTVAAPYTLNFFGGDGAPLPLRLEGVAAATTSVSGVLPVGGSTIIQSNSPAEAPLAQGWAQLVTSQKIDGLAVFRQSPPDRQPQEAAVRITSATSGFRLPFDNTQGFVTAMAIMNASATQTVNVNVVIRDENGTEVTRDMLTLGPRAHTAFSLPAQFPPTGNLRGVAEFSTGGATITGLGLRFNPGGAFTSFPVLVP